MGSSAACFVKCFVQFQEGKKENAASIPFPNQRSTCGEFITFHLFSLLVTKTIFSFPESLLLEPWQRTKTERKSTEMQRPGQPPWNRRLVNGPSPVGAFLYGVWPEAGQSPATEKAEEGWGRQRGKVSHAYVNPRCFLSSAREVSIWVSDDFTWTSLPSY